MAENKMKEVAQLLGVELGEKFIIKNTTFNPHQITKRGLVDKDGSRSSIALHMLLTGAYEIERTILDNAEKAYLEAVLRPFKDRVMSVEKRRKEEGDFIKIWIRRFEIYSEEYINFPYFKTDTIYKHMEPNKKYTLEELGLFEDE